MHRCYDWVFWLSVWDNETRCMFFYANFYLSVCIMRSFVLLAMSVCVVCVSVRVSDWKIFYWNTEFWNESWIFITLIIPTAPTSSQAETRPTYLHSLKSLTSIAYQSHGPRLNLFSSQNRQIKVSLASDLWSSLMYGFTTHHYINRKTQTWWVTCSVFRVVLSSPSHTRKTSEGTTQKITHLYFHISHGKNKNATWGGNTIKLPYLSSLEGRWMSGLPWGGMKACDPSGVFFLNQSILGQPQEGLQIGSLCRVRLIGGIQMAAI